jgi:peptidase propeptide and YPEB domain protein
MKKNIWIVVVIAAILAGCNVNSKADIGSENSVADAKVAKGNESTEETSANTSAVNADNSISQGAIKDGVCLELVSDIDMTPIHYLTLRKRDTVNDKIIKLENDNFQFDISAQNVVSYSGNVEYDYDIDAVSGDIVSYDYDIENYNIPVQPTEVQQTNADTVDIGVEKAKEIALSHAGHSLDKVSFVKAEIDYEDGIKVYDIDFYSGNVEYDYEINAATGSILSVDWDIEDYSIPAPEPAPTEAPAPAPAPTAAPAPAPKKAASSGISAERAKQIALSHAGVRSAHFTKVELDTEDGIRVYEIEFKVGNVEYDYDINAATGAIVSSSSEIDD